MTLADRNIKPYTHGISTGKNMIDIISFLEIFIWDSLEIDLEVSHGTGFCPELNRGLCSASGSL